MRKPLRFLVGVQSTRNKELHFLNWLETALVSFFSHARGISFVVLKISLLFVVETVHKKSISFVDSASEIFHISQQLLEVHSVLIKKHTSDSWSVLIAICLLNYTINMVADKIISILSALQGIQLSNINLRKLKLWKGSTRSWLLLLVLALVGSNILLLRLSVLLLIRLALILFVETTSALTSSTAISLSSSRPVVEFVVSSVRLLVILVLELILVHHMVILLHFVPKYNAKMRLLIIFLVT